MILQVAFAGIYVAAALIFVYSLGQLKRFLGETRAIDSTADLERFKELARGQMHLALVILALVEAVVSRVVLTDKALEMRSLRARRTLPVEEIRRVRWEGGSGVAVQLATGTWVKLPEQRRDAQGVANTIRAWLRPRGTEA